MATATAPTEAEIREAIRARIENYPSDDPRTPLREAIKGLAGILRGPAYDTLESPDPRDGNGMATAPEDLWSGDLRPSEALVLRRHGEAAVERAFERAMALIVEEIVAAALAAAAEIPDAPRAAREPVTA